MKNRVIYALLSLLVLAGCSGARDRLGLSKATPDEFAVVRRAPLEMPPDYALRPPRPGAPRPQEQAAVDAARAAVLGQTDQSGGTSAAESALIRTTGATNVPSNIRAKVDAEASEDSDGDVSVLKKIAGIGGEATPEGKAIDPVAEAARLKAQKAAEAKK